MNKLICTVYIVYKKNLYFVTGINIFNVSGHIIKLNFMLKNIFVFLHLKIFFLYFKS